MEDFKILFEDLMWSLMNALEEFVYSFNFAGGSKLREVWVVVFGFFGLSIILKIFNKPTFISWQESLVALIIMSVIIILDYVNVNGTESIKQKILSFRKGGEEDGV